MKKLKTIVLKNKILIKKVKIRKKLHSIEEYQNKYNIRYKNKKTVLISYPKSGRTWLRMILAKMLVNLGYNYSKYEMILTLHKGSLKNTLGYNYKILFLYRDPRDVVISYYFEMKNRKESYHDNISNFLRNKKYGIETHIKYLNNWYNEKDKYIDFMMISYNELKNNTFNTIEKVLKYLNVPYDNEKINNAIEYSSFESMKKIEKGKKKNYLQYYKGGFRAKKKRNKNSYRVRKGKIGGYKDYLNEKDLNYVNECMKKLNPIYGVDNG